jgi:DNA-binding NarL/FixJ family response regulator
MIRIVIADDHQIVIDGIKALLQRETELAIVGQSLNGSELLETGLLAEPDLILMDIGMPVMDGIAATRAIKKTHPGIRILVLTTHTDRRHIKQMLREGVNGYLLKDSGKDRFMEAIRIVMGGGTYLDQRVTETIMNSLQPQKKVRTAPTPLSSREKDIVRLIAEGQNTAEIAERLHISLLTVETHRKNIYAKLGLNKMASLIRYALEEGILE